MFKALHPLSYYLKADEFWLTAFYLERVSEEGALNWQEQNKMFDSKSGFIKIEGEAAHDLEFAAQTMKAGFNVSLYLRAVSVELILKGLYWEKFDRTPPMHHRVSEIYEALKNYIGANQWSEVDTGILLEKLNEILIWAGRYPEPKKDKYHEDGIRKLAKTSDGYYTEDLRLSIDLKLLKEFYYHVAKCIPYNQRNSEVTKEYK